MQTSDATGGLDDLTHRALENGINVVHIPTDKIPE